ncbi:hypothetical protein LguiA_027293 [Lonicera macranthoides]
MLRQSPSRNQRSKGVKAKEVLQICVLLAVCFWLIYQVKHSHDKKKVFDENSTKNTIKTRSADEILKFGRKDLNPRVDEATKQVEKHEEEEVEEENGVEEEEDNKNDEQEQEEEKIEEKEDEGRGGGDDEIDQHEQEKSDSEVDHEEEFVDEEKEIEEEEIEEKEGIMEDHKTSLGDHDDGVGAGYTHEAREEQYKADDASSAVTHDSETTTSTEKENGTAENSNENAEASILEEENKVNTTKEINVDEHTRGIKVEDEETLENGLAINSTANSSSITDEVSTEVLDLSLQNQTETVPHSIRAQNITLEEESNSSISAISIMPENGEASLGGHSNSLNKLVFVVLKNTVRSNASTEAEDSSGFSMTEGPIKAENGDEVEHNERDDSSATVEEKEARMDLDTLPDIRTEGSNSEYAAAE